MLKPIYDFNSNSKSVLLRRGMFEISPEKFDASVEKRAAPIMCDIRLNFLPYPQINIHHTASKHGFSMNVKLLPAQNFMNGIGNDDTVLEYAVFHIFNFPFIEGSKFSSMGNEEYTSLISTFNLNDDNWNIEIYSQIETHSNLKLLRQEGGYQITHVGKIRNKNGNSFTGKELTRLLNTLDFFLSFAKGSWCLPVCTVGYNNTGEQIWEMLSAPKGPWKEPCGWFNGSSGEQLSALFPNFMKIWQCDDWSAALTEVIYWYLQANSNETLGVDTGIILTQTALETLSYGYLVNHLTSGNGGKTKEEFENRSYIAAEKFRDLFAALNIPPDIPDECVKMKAFKRADGSQWQDSPEALTQIRNFLVHPKKGNKDKYSDLYFEAWKLGLWYLDLTILAICKYEGKYGNRLKMRYVGDADTVPY